MVRRHAHRQFRRDDGSQLPKRRQSGARCRQIPAAHRLYGKLRRRRGPGRDRDLSKDAARSRSSETAALDARIREICHRHPSARIAADLLVSDRSVPVICEGLEDQPQPLCQSGPRHDLARQIASADTDDNFREEGMRVALRILVSLVVGSMLILPAVADETPKRGGTLTYMIPADAPPSFDAQREETYATIHSAAPFYSTLIRANPMDPGSPDLVCDLCTEMP